MAFQTQERPFPIGGVALATAAVVTTEAIVGAAVQIGKGLFCLDLTVSGYAGGSGFDALMLSVEANTEAAPTVWSKLLVIPLGDATALGTAMTSFTNQPFYFRNDANYQVRLYSDTNGSATTATVTATIHPLQSVHAK